MKKIILSILIIISIASCSKSSSKSSSLTPAQSQSQVTCIFVTNGGSGNQRYLYKCAKTTSEVQQAMIQLGNQNLFYETFKRSECSECR